MTAVTFERRDSAHTRLFLAALVVVLVLYAAVGTLVIRHEAETGVRVAEASSVVVEVPVSSVADVPGSQATMVDGASSRVSSPAVAVEDGLPAGASSA